LALLEHCFIASSLSEQRSQHESVKCNHRHLSLGALEALHDRDARGTEAALAKGRCEQDSDGRGECPSYPERRWETRCKPQQEGFRGHVLNGRRAWFCLSLGSTVSKTV